MSTPEQRPEAEAIEIEIDWSDEPIPVYANGAQIVHSHREFSVAFTDFAAFQGRRPKPYPPRQGEVHERARVVSALRLTPDVFFQLIAAGAANWNKFVETFGQNQGMPRFQIIGPNGEALDGPQPGAQGPAQPSTPAE